MVDKIRCADCKYCEEFTPVGNTRSEFSCKHPDHEYIRKYFKEHKTRRTEGFIGYGARYKVPIKTSPAWCPKKAEGEQGE